MTSEAPQDVAALPQTEAGRAFGTPPAGTRLVLMADDLLATLGTRNEAGDRLTFEWGESDEHGWFTPTVTQHSDDNIAAGLLDQNDRLRSALEWALRNNGGECPADYPAGYANALRVLRGSGAEEAARNG